MMWVAGSKVVRIKEFVDSLFTVGYLAAEAVEMKA